MTLAEFIEEKIAIANAYRNLTDINPVEFVVEDANHNKFVVLVSHFEPDVNTVPFNVLWINSDPEHAHYKILQRRVDAESYGNYGYRHAWATISTTEEMISEPQYWKPTYDPILGEIEDFGLAPASENRAGILLLTHGGNSAETRAAISTNDARMSDSRTPIQHSHPQYPATMLAGGKIGNAKVTVYVANNDPKLGDVFVIDSISEDGLTIHGIWMAPKDIDLPYTGPLPSGMTIIGPAAPVDALTNHILRANVTFDDGSTIESVPATWTIINNGDWGAVGTHTGVFYAADVEEQEVIRVQASWTHPESGQIITKYIDITIRHANSIVYPISSKITGVTSVVIGNKQQYQFRVTYEDNSEVQSNPTSWGTSNSAIATIDSNGLLTAVSAGSVNINVIYTELGVNLNTTLAITVREPEIYSIRYGTATFANSQFTGGILEPLTEAQIAYGVTNDHTPQGQQYQHWSGVQEFFDSVLTQSLPNTGGSINGLALGVDRYLYIAYDARISNLSIMDLEANLPITFDGVNWPDDVLVPPETPTDPVALVTVNVNGHPQQWKIQRIDFPGAMTVSYSFAVDG